MRVPIGASLLTPLLFLTLLAGCDSAATAPDPGSRHVLTSLEVIFDGRLLAVGDSAVLRTRALDQSGAEMLSDALVWHSADARVATITALAGGRAAIAPLSPGTTRITVEAGSVQANVTINTTEPIAPKGSHLASAWATTCAIEEVGTARCWGDNRLGGLGDGTRQSRATPTSVDGGRSYVELTSGANSTCGLTPDGTVYCWGVLSAGDVYPPVVADRPVQVSRGIPFTHIDAGDDRLCGVSVDSDLFCWHSLSSGPVKLDADRKFAAVAVGWGHACALDLAGYALCWGDYNDGQLGDGTRRGHAVPAPVLGSLRFRALSAGYGDSCAISLQGKGYCWGWNGFAGVGVAGSGDVLYPTAIALDKPLRSISAGDLNTCADAEDGSTWCWGMDNGALGIGTVSTTCGPVDAPYGYCARAPAPVLGASGMNEIADAETHVCALDVTGRAWCWGTVERGQLGQGRFGYTSTPVKVIDAGVARLAVGLNHSCALMSDGRVPCWGDGVSTPTEPFPGLRFTTVGAAFGATCGVEDSGRTACWRMEAGDSIGSPSGPPIIDAGLNFDSVALGGYQACALTATGAAFCWPAGPCPSATESADYCFDAGPTEVPGGHAFRSISAGGFHTCGLEADGSLYCWGNVDYHPWPAGYMGESTTPLRFADGLQFRSISTAGHGWITCGVTTDHEGYCLDFNRDPVRVAASIPVASIAMIYFIDEDFPNGCVLDTSGTVWCQGGNSWGEAGQPVGANGGVEALTAVQAPVQFEQVARGSTHTCALAAGAVYCWGDDTSGQVGDGLPIAVTSPAPVVGGFTFAHP